jgi:hypothetical protein
MQLEISTKNILTGMHKIRPAGRDPDTDFGSDINLSVGQQHGDEAIPFILLTGKFSSSNNTLNKFFYCYDTKGELENVLHFYFFFSDICFLFCSYKNIDAVTKTLTPFLDSLMASPSFST